MFCFGWRVLLALALDTLLYSHGCTQWHTWFENPADIVWTSKWVHVMIILCISLQQPEIHKSDKSTNSSDTISQFSVDSITSLDSKAEPVYFLAGDIRWVALPNRFGTFSAKLRFPLNGFIEVQYCFHWSWFNTSTLEDAFYKQLQYKICHFADRNTNHCCDS